MRIAHYYLQAQLIFHRRSSSTIATEELLSVLTSDAYAFCYLQAHLYLTDGTPSTIATDQRLQGATQYIDIRCVLHIIIRKTNRFFTAGATQPLQSINHCN